MLQPVPETTAVLRYPTRLIAALVALAAVLVIGHFTAAGAAAATLTWNGSSSVNWGTAANWTPAQVPVANDDLVFPAGAANTATFNNLTGVTTYNSITVSGNSPAYQLQGSSVNLNVGLTVNSGVPGTVQVFILTGGTGGVTMSGSGTLVLTSSTGSYSGATIVNSGILQASGVALSPNSAFTVASGAILDLGSMAQSLASLSGAGNVVNDSAGLTIGSANTNTTFSGTFAGTSTGPVLTKTGSGTLTLTGNSSGLSGQVALNQGTLVVGANNALGTGTINLNGATLQSSGTAALTNGVLVGVPTNITGNGNLLLSGVITGTSALTENGTLTLTLTGGNSFGGFANSAGTTVVGNGSALGSGTITFSSGTTLKATGSPITISSAMTLNGAPTISGSVDLTLSGIIGASTGLTKSGTNTLTLSGSANSGIGGTVTVSGGTLSLTNSGAVGSAATLALNGGTLKLTSNMTVLNNVTLTSAGTVDIGANAITSSGVISGSGLLNLTGSGSFAYGNSETYTGGTAINGTMALFINSTGMPPATGVTTVASGACYCMSGAVGAVSTGNIAGSGTINLPSSGLTLGGDNSTAAFTGLIQTGSRTLTKTGTGQLSLTGTVSYTGATTVNGGTLLVTANMTSTPITVNSGGTLTGLGTLGSVTINNGGLLTPQLGSGGLTVSSLSMASGSTFFAGIGGTTANASTGGYEQLTVSGSASLSNPTLSVGLINSFSPTAGQTFTVISGPVTGTFNGIAQGGTVSTSSGVTFSVAYGSVILTAQTVGTTTSASPSPSPSASASAAPSSGGGGGGTTSTTTSSSSSLSTTSDVPTIAAALTSTSPQSTTQTVASSTGGVVTAGNTAFVFPAGAFGPNVTGNVTVTVTTTLPPTVNIPGLAGNVSASPNGTVVDLVATDSAGNQISSFATPIEVVAKPNAADLAMAGGDFSQLNVVYFVAPNTPSIFNPLGLPIGTAVFQPNVQRDPVTGTITWMTQNGAGVVEAVVANPISYVQTLNPGTPQFSSFDPPTSQTFGNKSQFSYLQVVEPQIPGANRLVVLDPDTGNYSYVNAKDVGPSGPPPPKSATAVVRGARGQTPSKS